jgi:hypothetical protein
LGAVTFGAATFGAAALGAAAFVVGAAARLPLDLAAEADALAVEADFTEAAP